jgi:hypothetical protein
MQQIITVYGRIICLVTGTLCRKGNVDALYGMCRKRKQKQVHRRSDLKLVVYRQVS